MSLHENQFDERFSEWEMVTGASGTFVRAIQLKHDLGAWYGTDEFMRSWYYDNDTPTERIGDHQAPEYPNGWSLCSATLDGQVRYALFQESFATCNMQACQILSF